jgi:hypothetical protein
MGAEGRRGRAEQRPGEMACAGDRAEAEGAEGVQRKKKGGKGSRDPFAKLKNYRDPVVIYFFPLI